jgi:hypothetical protein
MQAAAPVASQVITVKTSPYYWEKGSITKSTSVPADSHIFGDEDEVLTSIITGNPSSDLCAISMTTLHLPKLDENFYTTGWLCQGRTEV